MAKFRRHTRRISRFASRHARRSSRSSGIGSMLAVGAAAVAYGAARGYISSAISPITSKIPILGNYSDEAVLGLGGAYAMKKGKGLVKTLGTAVLIVEAASVGSQLASGLAPSSGASSQTYSQGGFTW